MKNAALLTVQGLTCNRNEQFLFKNLNFTVYAGQILHIQGTNGVGKSSLLALLAGLIDPAEGQIDYFTGQQIAYLGHKIAVKDRLTVRENLLMAQQLSNSSSNITVAEALAFFALTHIQHTECQLLSAGQKQRVALARLLLTNAKLWLLDEPFAALDQKGIAQLETLIKTHIEQNGSVILTSHQPLQIANVEMVSLNLDSV